jgi:hypothetical protein
MRSERPFQCKRPSNHAYIGDCALLADGAGAGLEPHSFDTIIDSASFHCFSLEDRAKYVATLEHFARPGCLLVR